MKTYKKQTNVRRYSYNLLELVCLVSSHFLFLLCYVTATSYRLWTCLLMMCGSWPMEELTILDILKWETVRRIFDTLTQRKLIEHTFPPPPLFSRFFTHFFPSPFFFFFFPPPPHYFQFLRRLFSFPMFYYLPDL